ncbi:MAG TPA: hypothetical protein VE912_19585 [Bacteroidales bacterium]|nr:hypothetical protein [Bacteroidales bacterium]
MEKPYSVILISTLGISLYLISRLFVFLGIYPDNLHKKIWNSLLLITFLISALLGFFLAIQINNKLDFPWIDMVTRWHVEIGLGLFVTGILHLSWHLSYYKKLFRKSKSKKQDAGEEKINLSESEGRILYLPVFLSGFTAVITQIILIREFISVFNGNELVIGIILANWMILTGFGALIGIRIKKVRNPMKFSGIALLLIGLLPFITAFALNYFRNIIFLPGVTISLNQIILSSIVILSPFCLTTGVIFTFVAHIISGILKENLISRVYAWEAYGSMAGGILFNFVLVFVFKTFVSLSIVMLINLAAGTWLLVRKTKPLVRNTGIAIACLIPLVIIFSKPDHLARSFLFKNQQLIYIRDTPYGTLAVTRNDGQVNFYENNVLLFNTQNIIAQEEDVHYTMVQHADPENVLLISGGISGTLNEILKYPVQRIDYVELNPAIIELADKFSKIPADTAVHIINQDARLYIKETKVKYDVVLINLPSPSTAQINRFYTLEFFRELKKLMNKEGVVSIGLPASANYITRESGELNSILYNTMKRIFKHVLIVPGEKNYFLASDKELTIDIPMAIRQRNISTMYVNQFYLSTPILQGRNQQIMEKIDESSPLNRDFTPVSYYEQLIKWLSQFKTNFWMLAVFFSCLIMFLLYYLKPVDIGILAGGFAASSSQVILLLAFQVIYGYVFMITGFIITLFMAGIAGAAFFNLRLFPQANKKTFINIQVAIIGYSLLIPVFLLAIKNTGFIPSVILHGIFFLISLIVAFITGTHFAVASRISEGTIARTAGKTYGADLFGSALGALLVTAYLIPVFGIIKVSLLAALINLFAVVYVKHSGRK